jgi:hypothetical protein
MPRPKPRPSTRSRPPRHLIRIDAEPVRQRARRDYEKARRDLEKARRELERFKAEDQPAFARWLHSTFGTLLTTMRELGQQLDDKEGLIGEMEDVSLFEGVEMGDAYRLVMHRRAHPDEARDDFPPPFEPGNDSSKGKKTGRENDPDADPGPDPFSGSADPFDEFFKDPFRHAGRSAGAVPKPTVSGRVKSLYRQLVRKLHPDVQETMTPEKLERWHEVQEAYAAGDAERLEIILNLSESEDGTPGAHTSVSLLMRITAQVKASLRQVKHEVNQYRKDPAWRFSKCSDRTLLEMRMHAEMEGTVAQLRHHLRLIERTLHEWAAEADRTLNRKSRGKKRGRKGSNSNWDQGFFF